MGERIPHPLAWKVVAFLDAGRQVDGAFRYRHGPQAFVGSHHGWIPVLDAEGKHLTFETPEEAQSWIDERKAHHG
ncbi:MAG: hypothetical protein AB1431_08885 [Pseudomonadota bacterium]